MICYFRDEIKLEAPAFSIDVTRRAFKFRIGTPAVCEQLYVGERSLLRPIRSAARADSFRLARDPGSDWKTKQPGNRILSGTRVSESVVRCPAMQSGIVS